MSVFAAKPDWQTNNPMRMHNHLRWLFFMMMLPVCVLIQRDWVFVLACLIQKYDMTLFNALKLVRSIRSIANPNDGFIDQLMKIENKI